MLALRHDDVRSQERLRPDHRVRAEDAARDPRARSRRTPSRSSRRSWARTRSRSNTATRAHAYVDSCIDEMIPAVAPEGLAEWCDVFCETGVFTPDESREILEAGARAGLKPRIHADELARERRMQRRRGGRRAVGGSSDLRRRGGRRRAGRGGVVATAAADRGVLPEARPLRAGADADRSRRAGRAGDRRQSRRRLLAVDAVRDDARLLRHGDDVRGGAGRRDDQRRVVARPRTIAIGSLEPGKQMDAVIVRGGLTELCASGQARIQDVIKRGKVVSGRMSRHGHLSVTGGTAERFRIKPAPVPGGGCAAALAGAVGASLLMMVAGLPKTRLVTRGRGRFTQRRLGCGRCAMSSRRSIDRDSEAYSVGPRGLPLSTGTDAEKAARREAIDRAMRAATETPLHDPSGHASRRCAKPRPSRQRRPRGIERRRRRHRVAADGRARRRRTWTRISLR